MTPKQQRSAETLDRILTAAETCFAEHGYDATGVAQICKQASVSKGAFYHHFSSKQAVFMALLNRWLEKTDQQLSSLRQTQSNIPESIRSMAVVPQFILNNSVQQLPIYLEFITQAIREPEIWQTAVEPYRRYNQFFAGIIQAGIQEGTLRELDPQIAASVMISFAVGILLQGFFDPNGADWEQVTQAGVDILLSNWMIRE